jgi:hypothetical protein
LEVQHPEVSLVAIHGEWTIVFIHKFAKVSSARLARNGVFVVRYFPIEIKGIEFQTGGRDMKCVVTEHSVASAFAAGIVRAYRALFWLLPCTSAVLPRGRTTDSSDPECVLPLVNTEGLAGGYASTPDVLGLNEEHGIFPLGGPIADARGNLSSAFAV